MKTSRGQKNHVLTNQKVVKRPSSFRLKANLSKALPLLTFFSCIFFCYKIWSLNLTTKIRNLERNIFPSEFIFHTDPDHREPLKISETEDLLLKDNIRRALQDSKKGLASIAGVISEKMNYESVLLYLDQDNRLHITPRKYHPLSILMGGDKNLFLSDKGIVFESSSFTSSEIDSLVKTFGLPPESTKDRDKIKELVLLINTLKTQKVECHTIHFEPLRGYSIYLKNIDAKFLLGFSPYESKLKHLRFLLKDSATIQSLAVVELDYDGKAFLKEKEPLETNQL